MRWPRLGAGCIAAMGLLALQVHEAAHAVVYLAPLLILLLALLAGRYPGSDALCRAAARRRPGDHPRGLARPPGRGRARALLLPRGGRLVGASLAGRGPPAATVA